MSEANEYILIPETLNLGSRTSYPRQKELYSKMNEKVLIEALENEIIPHMPITTFKEIQTPETTPGICRICLQSDLEESNRCISPCLCRGSISKVHRTCLEKWLLQADSSYCEICTFKYNTRWITKYSLLGSLKGWFFSRKNQGEIKELFRDLFILLIIVLLLSWLSFLKVFIIKLDRDIQVKYCVVYRVLLFSTSATITIVDFSLGFLSTLRIHYHITHWYNFYKKNKKVIVLDLKLPEDSVNACTG